MGALMRNESRSSCAIACIRPRRRTPRRARDLVPEPGHDVVADGQVGEQARLAVGGHEAGRRGHATAGSRGLRPSIRPTPRSKPAMDRTSSRAPEPSTPTSATISPARRAGRCPRTARRRCVQPASSSTVRRSRMVGPTICSLAAPGRRLADHQLGGDRLLRQRVALQRSRRRRPSRMIADPCGVLRPARPADGSRG